MTTLRLKHIDETPNSTVSGLLLNDRHLCYIIEDGHRDVKEFGETRIPAGKYELFPRKSGGFFSRYSKRFRHKFVIGFKDVPGFTYILMHIGNTKENTHGCLLTNTHYHLDSSGNYRGTKSTDAYLSLYNLFVELFNDGKVFIEIDRGGTPYEPEQPPTNDPPVVSEPEENDPPDIPTNGCLVHPLVIISLLCFGAAIGSL